MIQMRSGKPGTDGKAGRWKTDGPNMTQVDRDGERRHDGSAETREPKATARSRTCAVRSQSVIRPEGPEMPRRG